MGSSRIRADFDSLGRVGKIFGQQAQATKRALQKINQQVSTLQGGDWVGKGANEFYKDMDDLLLPSLNRLIKALEAGEAAMRKVDKIMHQADEDQRGLYRGDPAGGVMAALRAGLAAAEAAAAGVGAAGGGASGGAAGGAGAGGGAASGGGGAGSSSANPFLVADPGSLLSPAGLQGIIGIEIQGAGSQLGQLMGSLGQSSSGGGDVSSILIEISGLRGRPTIEIEIEFGKFQDIQAQQGADAAGEGAAAAQAASEAAGGGGGGGRGFQGSMTQMRYGKVVGDALGVDPVFGAMLNPTGGLVGPGKYAIAGGATPVGYHAVAHAAAGYLHDSLGAGPGLNYTGLGQSAAPAANHLAGIGYWRGATGGSSSVAGSSGWALGSVAGKVDMAGSVLRGVKSVF